MGEFISISDALTVTLFSIVMVFLVLIVISIFISMLKGFDVKEKPAVVEVKKNIDNVKKEEVETVNDEELIAVISAALAASMGLRVPDINIKNIRRVGDDSPAWSRAGRQEQLYSKL